MHALGLAHLRSSRQQRVEKIGTIALPIRLQLVAAANVGLGQRGADRVEQVDRRAGERQVEIGDDALPEPVCVEDRLEREPLFRPELGIGAHEAEVAGIERDPGPDHLAEQSQGLVRVPHHLGLPLLGDHGAVLGNLRPGDRGHPARDLGAMTVEALDRCEQLTVGGRFVTV